MQEHPSVGEDGSQTPQASELRGPAAETPPDAEASAAKAQDEPRTEAQPRAASGAKSSETAVVALPGLRQEQPKTSFWKRIRLARRGGISEATDADRVIARLDGIASRIEAGEQEMADRIRFLDERLAEVWEVEEQLSRLTELREMLGDIQERQGRIDGRTRSLERRLSLIATLAGVAAAAGLGAIALALL